MEDIDDISGKSYRSVELTCTSECPSESGKRVVLTSCPEPCQVCGGKSTGYHYGVTSCNGCKSFFRRTILDKRTFQCKFKNDCHIPMQEHKRQKRRKCRSCRFKSCAAVGMNPLAIVSDQTQDDIMGIFQSECNSSQVPLKRITSFENRAELLLEDLIYCEHKLNLLRKSTYNFRPDCGITIDYLLDNFTPIGTSYSEMPSLVNWAMTPIDIEFHLHNRIPLPTTDYNQFPPNFKFWFYMDMIYQVAWISSFDFFNDLDRADKISIVKIVTRQLIILVISYFSYSNKSSSVIFPDGSNIIWKSNNMFDVVQNCFDIQLDEREKVLLKVLLLSNPTWEQLSAHARVLLTSIQEKYTQILLDYCLRNHGAAGGPARLTTLIQLHNTIINKASNARSNIELMTILKLRSMRDTLVEQIWDLEKL